MSSRSLIEIQRLIATAVMTPLNKEFGISSTTNSTQLASRLLKPSKKLSPMQRLEILNQQYWFRLIDCLFDDFPGLSTLLGEDNFHSLAVAYIEEYPSDSYSLRELGSNMVEFLNENPHLCNSNQRFAIDLTRFEWAQITAFDRPAWKQLNPESIKAIPASELTLELQPYLTLLDLEYPIDDFVISLRRNRADTSEAHTGRTKSVTSSKHLQLPDKKKTYLAVHRLDNILYCKQLAPNAYHLLAAIQRGETLENACATLSESVGFDPSKQENFAEMVTECFSTWNTLGWFCTRPK